MNAPGVTLAQAAIILSISTEGVRKRIKRGSLHAVKDDAGRWTVYMPPDKPDIFPQPVRETRQTTPDTLSALTVCARCSELEVERAGLVATVEGLREQIAVLLSDRDAWQQQAQQALQALNQQQALSLPGAVRDMQQLPAQADKRRGVWGRMLDALKRDKQ